MARLTFIFCFLIIGPALQAIAQSVPADSKERQSPIIRKANESEAKPHDAGSVRFLVTSQDTRSVWSLVELVELPGYKTNIHRHNRTDEAFYVLEGIFTVYLDGQTHELAAGSYVFIPRGTPHAQGNRGKNPVKLLLTMTPGGFERSFEDRVELMRTIKPDDPDFRKKRQELRIKKGHDVEPIREWIVN